VVVDIGEHSNSEDNLMVHSLCEEVWNKELDGEENECQKMESMMEQEEDDCSVHQETEEHTNMIAQFIKDMERKRNKRQMKRKMEKQAAEEYISCLDFDDWNIPSSRKNSIMSFPSTNNNCYEIPTVFEGLGPYPSESWLDFHLW
jgi:hypothetical protein